MKRTFTATPEHPPYVPPMPIDPDNPEPPTDSTVVGVSVTLNWNDAGQYNPYL